MNKQIRGKRYNTDTAEKVMTYGQCELYRKRSGEFFITDNIKLKPITLSDAKKIIKAYGTTELYNKYFDVPGNEQATFAVRLPKWLIKEITDAAVNHKLTISKEVETSLISIYGDKSGIPTL